MPEPFDCAQDKRFGAHNRYDPYQPGDGSCDCGAQSWHSCWLSDGSHMSLCLDCGWWEVVRGAANGNCSIDSGGRWWKCSGKRLAPDFQTWAESVTAEAAAVATARLAEGTPCHPKPPKSASSDTAGRVTSDKPARLVSRSLV